MRAAVRRLLVVGVLVALLAACKADATVTVRMHEDGSGVVAVRVVLDGAAVRAAEVGGGKLADRVRLADLTGAGWTVTPWRRTPSGGAVLTVTKPFARPEEVRAIVGELNGAHGPLRGFRASRDVSRFSTTWKAAGTVDLRRLDLGIADDEQLVANLTNERVDVAGVEPRIAASALAGLQVRARVELPGGDVHEVRAVPGKRAVLAATADDTDLGRIALVFAGVVVAVLAVVLLVVGETRARRRRSRRSVPPR
jgi:hypothetical protein